MIIRVSNFFFLFQYFYSIRDISIGGRCRCNGHADTCTSVDDTDPYKLVCDCKDNTCGHNCEYCCPGFEQKKWSQSKSNKKFVCESKCGGGVFLKPSPRRSHPNDSYELERSVVARQMSGRSVAEPGRVRTI